MAPRVPGKGFICFLSLVVSLSLSSSGIAAAEIYDDFSTDKIDLGKWTLQGTPGLFSQSKGRLHFSCSKDTGQSLVSTRSFGAGFFRMEFYDFYSANDAASAQGKGSIAALGLGPRNHYVRVMRGRVRTGGYFEANYIKEGKLQLWYVPTEVSIGQLALFYDGVTVSYFYNYGMDPSKGWQRVGPKVTPGWNSPPNLFITGYPGSGGLTRFSADNVEYTPPLSPPDSLLKILEK